MGIFLLVVLWVVILMGGGALIGYSILKPQLDKLKHTRDSLVFEEGTGLVYNESTFYNDSKLGENLAKDKAQKNPNKTYYVYKRVATVKADIPVKVENHA